MPVTLRCPHCRTKSTFQKSPRGKSVICAECERKFTPPADDDLSTVDDELPRSRNARDEDDDAERPRNRKVRPAKRTKRRKKRRGLPRFVLPTAGVAIFLAVSIVLYLFVIRPLIKETAKDAGGTSGPAANQRAESDLLAWAPSDSTSVTFLNYRALAHLQSRPNNPYRNLGFGMAVVPRGIDINDFDAAMLANTGGNPYGVYALRLKSPNADAIDQAMVGLGGRPKQVGAQTVYQTQRYTMYRASDRVMVVSERPDHIESCIRSSAKSIVLMGNIAECVSRASGDAWEVRVGGIRYVINGLEALSSTTMLEVREDGVMYSSDITYVNDAVAAQAKAQARGAEAELKGSRVILRNPNGSVGVGIGLVGLRW